MSTLQRELQTQNLQPKNPNSEDVWGNKFTNAMEHLKTSGTLQSAQKPLMVFPHPIIQDVIHSLGQNRVRQAEVLTGKTRTKVYVMAVDSWLLVSKHVRTKHGNQYYLGSTKATSPAQETIEVSMIKEKEKAVNK
ncbi:hypothetical protein B7494_g3564 [Chlorociboria aeruginascens]|nr:hypothetical protein B7494_g3564 [Chlorociboria aeruginascens]